MTDTASTPTHWTLATLLLAGRSLSDGPPWEPDFERRLVRQERILWFLLSPEERERDQQALQDLWFLPDAERVLPPDPIWPALAPTPAGGWPDPVPISRRAFGPFAGKGYLPAQAEGQWSKWLWERGFRTVAEAPGGNVWIEVPQSRSLLSESDRLVRVLGNAFGPETLDAIAIRGVYDPMEGSARIELSVLDVAKAQGWLSVAREPREETRG